MLIKYIIVCPLDTHDNVGCVLITSIVLFLMKSMVRENDTA